MARRITRRGKAILSSGLHPHYVSVAKTMARFTGDVLDTGAARAGRRDRRRAADRRDRRRDQLRRRPISRHPRPDRRPVADRRGARTPQGALLIAVVTEPVALGLIRSPGEMGADIVVGEGQSIGVGLQFGGPYVGLFACREKYVRQMPGRLAGETVDAEGKRGFVLTLSTREQHIRREKATSNICTNSGLCALAFSVHMTLLGEKGLRRLAELNHARAVAAAERLAAIPGVELVNDSFLQRIHAAAAGRSAAGGARAGRARRARRRVARPALSGRGRRSRTAWSSRSPRPSPTRMSRRLRSGAEGGAGMTINPSRLAADRARERGKARRATVTGNRALMLEEPLIFEIGDTETTGVDFDRTPSRRSTRLGGLERTRPIGLAGLSEPETVRHYTRLSRAELRDRPRPVPARLVHDEAQSAPQREGRAAAGLRRHPPAAAGRHGAGRARADRPSSADWLVDADRHARRGDEPQGRRAWRAVRPAVHPRGARGARRRARGRAGPGKRARHQSGDRRLRRLSGREHPRQRRRPGRSRRAEGAARARRRGGDDHQPQHLRPVRARHDRDQRGGPCGRRLRLLRRRQFQRDRRPGPPGRPRHRCDAHQPAQDLLDPARRRRAGLRARSCSPKR